jgi:hypothetical protein
MNFKQFLELTEPVSFAHPAATVQTLDVNQALQIITRAAQDSFGRLPNTRVSTGEEELLIMSPSREINIHMASHPAGTFGFNQLPAHAEIPEMDIEFAWNYDNEPTQLSPKDSSSSFPIAKEVDKETFPLVKAFKAFLLQLRNYPITASYVAIGGRGSVSEPKNRRASLYQKVFDAVGYTRQGSTTMPTWIPPVLIH